MYSSGKFCKGYSGDGNYNDRLDDNQANIYNVPKIVGFSFWSSNTVSGESPSDIRFDLP